MANAIDVASYILGKRAMTNEELQNILYLCQGMYYARYNETLFPDKIEVWKYGPVVRSVYENYDILKNGFVYGMLEENEVSVIDEAVSHFPDLLENSIGHQKMIGLTDVISRI